MFLVIGHEQEARLPPRVLRWRSASSGRTFPFPFYPAAPASSTSRANGATSATLPAAQAAGWPRAWRNRIRSAAG